ncbi:hypothetical protein [Azospirillum sp. sgz301742]
MSDFSKEARRERARTAGLASAAKRKAAQAAAVPEAPSAPPEPSTDDITAPVVTRRPVMHDAPVPERPVSFGSSGRVAQASLADAMAPPEMPDLAAALAEPERPAAEIEEVFEVLGTDVGGGCVYCAGDITWTLQDVRRLPGQIPGPGDQLVRYTGAAQIELKVKE